MITTVIIDESESLRKLLCFVSYANSILALSEAETACLSRLYISDYEGHRDRIERPIAGTCTWILNHPKYKEWVRAETPSMLWVSADPGCGKSVLTSFLVDAQSTDNSRATICYFFFKDDNDQQRRSNFAIAAILHQIYTSQPGLIKHALKWHQAKGTTVSTSFPDLWKVFIETVEDERARDIVCLIDALDECQAASCEEFMAALVAYFSSTSQRRSRSSNLKVLVTSRPENSIKQAFQKLPRIRLKGEDETDSISRDVAILVQANIDQLQDAGLPYGLLANLQKQLIEGADRTFLWVTLIIQLLKDASKSGASQNQLDAIIRSRDIDEVYNRLLQRSAAPLKAKSMLQIVLAATSPLCLNELSVATALNWKHKTLTDLEGDIIHPFDNYIRTLCGNFLRIVEGKVYLVHQTAREFLLKSHPSKTSKFVAGTHLQGLEFESKQEKATLERLLDDLFPSLSNVNDRKEENDNVHWLMNAPLLKEFKSKVVGQLKMILTEEPEVKETQSFLSISMYINQRLAQINTEEDENKFLDELQSKLNVARAEAAKRKFLKVTTKLKDRKRLKHVTSVNRAFFNTSVSTSGAAYDGFFNGSISLSEAHYYLLNACIHFLRLVPADSHSSTIGLIIKWTNPLMEPFFIYAASAWPIHYSESRSEHTISTIQLCKELCSPSSPSFAFWTRHNELYNLKFPQGRTDIRGRKTDHASEVSRTFLGLIFSKQFVFGQLGEDHEVILEASDSDNDKDDDNGVQMNSNRWTEAGQDNFGGQEHLAHSYRFREYRKAAMRSSDTAMVSMAYVPNSFLEEVSPSSYNLNSD